MEVLQQSIEGSGSLKNKIKSYTKMFGVSKEVVTEQIDADGVVSHVSTKQKKFRGKPVSVELYVKVFQRDSAGLANELKLIEHILLSHVISQIDGTGNQFYLFPKDAQTLCSRLKNNSQFYAALKGLKKAGLIREVSQYRYVLNPYYAAVGSDFETKELRTWWDEQASANNKCKDVVQLR